MGNKAVEQFLANDALIGERGFDAVALRKSGKPLSDLALFLNFLRRRIDPDVLFLGSYVRLPGRIGKRVTQQELADASRVTRAWYAALESAAATRTSMALLDRLADALMVTPGERARLFHLALPAMGQVQLRDDSIAVLEAHSRLRSLTRRLWAETSIDDILTTASEQIAGWFDGALLVSSIRRHESGLWESRPADDKQERNKVAQVIGKVRSGLLRTTGSLDALNLYPRLANAGDVATPGSWPLALRREALKTSALHRVAGVDGLYARVRSRSGFTGALYIAHELGERSYSASEKAVFVAFAEFTSFALS
jgi:transcriptional regulator with XRE-family HTH domain